MGRRHHLPSRHATLEEALDGYVVSELKQLAALVTSTVPTRKRELVEAIALNVRGDALRPLWESLGPLQKAAVADAVHEGPAWDADRFRARHGRLPDFGKLDRHGRRGGKGPTALRLFLPGRGILPDDLRDGLVELVPPPETPAVDVVQELPGEGFVAYDGEERRLRVRAMETTALHDLRAVLRLVERGDVRVTEKKREPTAATVRAVTDVLLEGDFYGDEDLERLEIAPDVSGEIGPMRAFAWPMLLQAGRLTRRRGGRLELTGAGKKALHGDAPGAVLADLWRKWETGSLLDEFSRVSAIKGQGRKGARGMTKAAHRRAAVADALADLPPGGWVEVDELFRHMRAVPHDFEVTHDPWTLYVGDRHYGTLGYDGHHGWGILQGRYTLAVLFEYAATLGLLDVAYVDPHVARSDFTRLWGSDFLFFLSRYDGLRYVRLTPLGAYALGLEDVYDPPAVEAKGLKVLPDLDVVASGEVAPEVRLTLDRYAVPASERVWRLEPERVLEAAEDGHPPAALRDLLEEAHGEALPDTVDRFLDDMERRSGAVRDLGAARLFECASEELATLVATDRRAAGLCERVGERKLLVRQEDEARFRKAVRGLGWGVTAGGAE